ncbi:GspE/PulE family protein [Noviherbaspirillum galbum]|uniref:GspE/PulE family protein n=1 Tax=Noviherbaspirillum galbum TaxID=2709383 RepID=A0A6B3SS92_9BURK|nr:GspE/PulE family protein [Noviherbaspirillum galbum]NEX60469.1 GspE/PulE family protein [Noviherbaspirillum galbum]
MSAVLGTQTPAGSQDEVASRLDFLRKLQAVTNKIHSTANVDEIMLDLSQDICDLFDADRLTIYALAEDKASIVSKIKTGLNSVNQLKLPISDQSVAGYVALVRRAVNIRDVYDEQELKAHSPKLHFLREVDKRTGYRTKQMLVGPIVDEARGELLGVVQLINHRDGDTFPAVLEEGIRELCKTLAIAYTQRLRPAPLLRSKYHQLVSDAVLSAGELEEATRAARNSGRLVEDHLVEEFQVKLAWIGVALSRFFGLPYEPFRQDRVRPSDLLKNLKREFMEQSQWLPIEDGPEGMVILATDPEQVSNARVINTIFPKARLAYRVTTHAEFRQTLDQFFGAESSLETVVDLLSGLDDDDDDGTDISEADLSAAAENELVKLVNKIIIDAYRAGASDIHIEPRPGKEKTVIRFRKDGSLENYIEVPASYRNALAARIKIMCELDISERRKPQDGKIRFKKFAPLDIELRVATIPSAGGVEDIVMRILAAGEPIPLEKLGVLPHNLERLKNTVTKPYGLFFVCGPTGSGKTTTLHSVLHYLNTPDTKIWTAEDPVEITQRGLRQVQVNRKSGLDFATAMRAFLRADPDVIMVGEMRDKETVAMGIEASLTGHLVFSTLHTNSAPESIVRLLDMGMDPFNFADALLGVLAQRLAKRLCSHCRQAYEPTAEELELLLAEYCEELRGTESFRSDADAARTDVLAGWKRRHGDAHGKFTLYRAVGCDQCNQGYKGRVGLHELMIGTDRLKRLIQEHSRVAVLLASALEDGMLTLKMDGIEKVLSGITDVKQVRAVCIK